MSATVEPVSNAIDIGSDEVTVGMTLFKPILGSRDDKHWTDVNIDVADSISWFRSVDNNPVIVDGLTIDSTTYKRSVTSSTGLPAGDDWGASANWVVAESLGVSDTQAVMYSTIARTMEATSLSADDVNMVRMAMTGSDRLAGTADDYTVNLSVVACGQPHDIAMKYEPLTFGAGVCDNQEIDYAFAQNPLLAIHYVLKNVGGPATVTLNSNESWDFGAPDISLSKTDHDVTANPGDTIVYTIGVSNIGDADAEGVTITELVPVGTTFNAGASSAGWTCADGAPAGSLCDLLVGTLVVAPVPTDFLFAVAVNSPAEVGEVLNAVTGSDNGVNGADPNQSNNTADDFTPINVPCNGNTDINLTSPVGDPTIVYEACNSITAGTSYTITTGRDVEFRARNVIAMTDGFDVESGAVFKAILDPLAGQTAAATAAGSSVGN